MSNELKILGDYLWDSTFAKTVDRLATDTYGIAALALMETAGRGVAKAVQDIGEGDAPVVVLVGAGNNGGDALVAARCLAEAGAEVHCFLVTKDGEEPGGACGAQLKTVRALEVPVEPFRPGALKRFAKAGPVIIDGVLGLGFKGPLADDSPLRQALTEAAAIEDATVVAVDLPSALDPDSGEAQDVPLEADLTVTFGGKKPALVLSPARDACGEVLLLDIGFPQAASEAALGVHRPQIVLPDAKELLLTDPWSELPKSAHKYDRGHVLILGGSAGKTGAPILAAMAALRSGAGWATVAMPDSATLSLRGDVPREITFEPLFDGERLNSIKLEKFLAERKVKAVVAGPGSMTNPLEAEALAVLADYVSEEGFVCLDAGATHGVARLLYDLSLDPMRWVMTPHPGEWTKLGLEFDGSPLSPAGFKKIAAEAERLGSALLYKHATPVLVTGNPKTPGFVVAEGTEALARAGSGDLLAGTIGAHGAVGMNSVLATLRSQALIAWAAVLAGEKAGRHAVLARDILGAMGRVVDALENEGEADEDE